MGFQNISVHIKADTYVKVKKGVPGSVGTVRTDHFLKSSEVDALHRFIGRIELGLIPQA